MGNTTGWSDENGNQYAYEYDDLNRLVRSLNPFGDAFSRTYDAGGNLTSYTDQNGHTTA